MRDIEFRGFRKNDVAKMRKTFNLAFIDYIIPIHLSHGQFIQKIIQKTNISFKYSVGSYYNRKLVGFIYNSLNYYEDKKTAYNGGTGVIADFRGNRLTERMYESVLPKLMKNGIEQCILEVISNNKPAIKVYENLGFKRTKFYHCMKLTDQSPYLQKIKNKDSDLVVTTNPEWKKYSSFCDYSTCFLDSFPLLKKNKKNFDLVVTSNPKWKEYSNFCDYSTCFLDSFPLLKKNRKNETIIEAYLNNQLIGFLVFNRNMGRVEQIGVDHKYRGQGIGSILIIL